MRAHVSRRDKIGFIFQFFNLLPTLSAKEEAMLLRRPSWRGKRGKELDARAEELLTRVGLGSRMGHRPDQMSGGEMQRVAISRALIVDPPVLLGRRAHRQPRLQDGSRSDAPLARRRG